MERIQDACKAAVRDEAALRAALAEADISPTLMVLGYLTGDASVMEDAAPYIEGGWNYMERVPAAIKETVREHLVRVLKQYASGERGLPDISQDQLRRMMGLSVGAEVPAEYVPMVLDELRLGAEDTRAPRWQAARPAAAQEFKVVIIGAGIAGICAGVRLQQAGIPFEILERNPAPGGTWLENTYPGCGVDTPNHFYSFSFNPKPDWTRHFALQEEINRYLLETVKRFGLDKHIRYNSEVIDAAYQEDSCLWKVRFRQSNQATATVLCNSLITAVGHNVPAKPSIAGLESFKGEVLHTATWKHDVALQGKRVAMIGTGASGMQVGPAIADKVAHLHIFQRTPHWVMGNPNYHRQISEGQKWALTHIPFFAQWYRFQIFWATSDGVFPSLMVDPQWSQPERSLNKDNHALRERIEAYIREQLQGDEELIAKCTPSYPPYGKRLLRDNHWYQTVRRPNVSLVTESIERIAPEGVLTCDGKLHEVDVIVCATGFHASRLLWPMDIRGRGGKTVRELWGDDNPRAYKGMAIPGFPNLFVLAGPNTTLSHGGSAVFQIECQVKYVTQALVSMIERNLASLEVRPEVHDDYNKLVDERHSRMVWTHPGVTSWYKNKQGRVTMTSPWRLVDFWRLTREFDLSEYLTRPALNIKRATQAAGRQTGSIAL